ncbi:MAG: hypothetical protein J0L92_28455 [Deltaproteobacteria bacterium]|nr:hypothetical protein [Deltaproteobacteria bacterium]
MAPPADGLGARGRRSRYRTEDGRVCIDLHVERAAQIFAPHASTPFFQRGLHEEIVTYVVECASDIGRADLRLVVIDAGSSLDAAGIEHAFRERFEHELRSAHRKLRAALRAARRALVLGTALMLCLRVASELAAAALSSSQGLRLVEEGLVIVSWIALWRPIEFVLFDLWPVYERRGVLRRLRDCDVSVRPLQ